MGGLRQAAQLLILVGLLLLLLGPAWAQQQPSATDRLQVEEVAPRTIFPLRSYHNLQVLRWRVPVETQAARWTLWANASSQCGNLNVTFWVKAGSFPVLAPGGGHFPPQMLPVLEHQTRVSVATGQQSGNTMYPSSTLEIEGPRPGHWYMMTAYLATPTAQIADPPCSAVVMGRAEYRVQGNLITLIPIFHSKQDIRSFYTIKKAQAYRFIVPSGAWQAQVNVTKCSLRGSEPAAKQRVENCPIVIRASPEGLPPSKSNPNSPHMTLMDCGKVSASACNMDFPTMERTTHYLTVTPTTETPVQFAISVKLTGCEVEEANAGAMMVNAINTELVCGEAGRRPLKILFPPSTNQEDMEGCGERIELARRTAPGLFSFDYLLPGNTTRQGLLRLTPDRATLLSFDLEDSDVGGTLAVELAILPGRGSGVGGGGEEREVAACLTQGYRVLPKTNMSTGGESTGTPFQYQSYACPGGRLLLQNTSNSAAGLVFEQVLVPFPPSGRWHLSLLSHCHMAGQGRRSACADPSVQVVFALHSNSCISGSCGRYGHCYEYLSGGAMFSACSCLAGHKGWGCNDASSAVSDYQLLTWTLLVTLTSLATLPVVVLALFRGHYAESFVYFSHLVSSCLYHACDQDIYSVCVLHLSVLQFCDIFTDILCSWVTILAMCWLPNSVRSVLQTAGVLGIAVAVQGSRASPLTVVVPCLLAVAVLITSWLWRCASIRSCYPGPKYLLLYCLPGVGVGAAGLLSLRLVNQESSSGQGQYLHAAWHLARGVALILLLPESPRGDSEPGKEKAPLNGRQFPPTEGSFKHLSDSNQSSVDDMAAVARGDGQTRGGMGEERGSQHQL